MSKFNRVKWAVAGLACGGALLFAGNASAYFIDFEQGATDGGSLVCSGGECVGTDIPMLQLKADTDSDGSGDVFADVDTLMNFDTSVGTISIVGDALGLTGETLLSGTIDSWNSTTFGGSIAFSATGPDSKSVSLLEELGIPTDISWEYFTFSLTSESGVVTSADILNVQVPAPGVLGLLGIGFAGLAFAGWHRSRRAG